MDQKTRELVIGFLSIALGVLVHILVLTTKMPPGAAMFPRLGATAIIVLGALQAAAGMTLPSQKKDGAKSESLLMLGKVVGIIILHIVLLKYFGFIISNLFLISSLIYIAGYKKYLNIALITVGVTAFLFLVFSKLLGISLPAGTLF